jgi:hypothetical protein
LSKKIAFAFAALSMLLVLAATMNSASAAFAPIPGVKAGDTADYKVVGDPYFPYNRTHIAVWGTKASYVALTATNYLPDGTLYSVDNHNWTVDFYGSGSWPSGVFYWVVSKNLTVGPDEILGAVPGVYVVNNLTMTAAGVSRFVLHANGSSMVTGFYFDMYFDRATGLVVQGNYGTPAGWLNVTLISTNVWSAAQPPPGVDLMTLAAIGEGIVIVVLVILTLFLALRMRRKR